MDDQFIGNYKILRKLGAGGMASVYLASHRDVPNLKVVLKVLSDPRLVERFRQEADKLALLDGNAHICQIKHFFNHGDEIVIAMEFIDGETLDEIVRREGKLAPPRALDVISEVLATLAFAHEKKIHHRDIKPGNIMIDNRGQVKIIDFGIAKSENDPSLTMAGSACGTPSYMAPEQFNPTDQMNYALADVYAVGTTLFYLLTGQLPFTGDNPFALRDAKLFSEPRAPRDIDPSIPKALEEVILTSIDKDPENRFQSVLQMKEAVDRLRSKTTEEQPTQAATPVRKPAAPGKKRPLAVIAAPIAVIVLAIAAYFLFFRGPAPIPPLAPQLREPVSGAVLSSGQIVFAWEPVVADGGQYRLEYADNAAFQSSQQKQNLTAGRYPLTAPLANGTYFWRVEAIDKNGLVSGYSPAASFTVNIPVVVADTGAAKQAPQQAPQPQTAELAMTIEPQGDVYIDGHLYGKAVRTAARTLDAGRHIIRVENSAAAPTTITDTVTLVAGKRQATSYRFTVPATTPEPAFGEVRIGSRPIVGATVYIDGELQPRQTPNTFRLPAGKHLIRGILEIDGINRERIDSVFVERNGVYKVTLDFEK